MIRRIMITGPESTGKSHLAQLMAAHYNTLWVPERARSYLNEIGRPYTEDDLLQIAREQLDLEDELARQANHLLFCDTGMLVLKIWSEHAYGRCHPWILEQLRTRHYAHYLLPDIDLPWQADPQREHPQLRDFFFNWYQQELQEAGKPYTLISGQGQERLQKAIKAIEGLAD